MIGPDCKERFLGRGCGSGDSRDRRISSILFCGDDVPALDLTRPFVRGTGSTKDRTSARKSRSKLGWMLAKWSDTCYERTVPALRLPTGSDGGGVCRALTMAAVNDFCDVD